MRLVHEPVDGDPRVLAADVETADSLVAQTKGLMFRKSVPDDYALVFRFHPGLIERVAPRLPSPLDGLETLAQRRSIHMAFVRVPLDVLWLRDGEVVKVETLRPWRGLDAAPADTVVELAGGAAANVEPGDRVELRESLDGDWIGTDWRYGSHRGRISGRQSRGSRRGGAARSRRERSPAVTDGGSRARRRGRHRRDSRR